MQCSYFDAGACRSCTWLERPYAAQLAAKQAQAAALLGALPGGGPEWEPPVASAEAGYRNRAKMVVGGTAREPVIGILDERGRTVDLRDCPLHTAGLRAALAVLGRFVTVAGLTPYDVATRRGELKYLLVTESPDGELMVRFVCRSTEPLARLRKHLPALLAELPAVRVASLNVQPRHAAVLEGAREELLTAESSLTMRIGDLALALPPQSFFQTNTAVAAELYRQARKWVDPAAATLWDLYCGVGGFALHCADGTREVVGVEASAAAVAGATRSAERAGLTRVRFVADDAAAFACAAGAPPDVVVVNPPRRGIGDLAAWLEDSGVRSLLYSSCNPESLARDLAAMPSLAPRRARLLDMFPQTPHAEVLVLAERR